jgi:hypothetical protein
MFSKKYCGIVRMWASGQGYCVVAWYLESISELTQLEKGSMVRAENGPEKGSPCRKTLSYRKGPISVLF